MVISSIEREPFAKISGPSEINIAKIVRKGAFAKYTCREILYVYSIHCTSVDIPHPLYIQSGTILLAVKLCLDLEIVYT